MLMLVEVQPLKKKGDANSARMEIDHQNEAGKSRGNQRYGRQVTLPLGKWLWLS